MRHHWPVLSLLPCALLGGCGMPSHSNALVFATNTTIALDVSASPTAGAPNITLGYKRQEAAWVPLLANKGANKDSTDRTPNDCSKPGGTPPPATPVDYSGCVFKGTAKDESDAYSVMASLDGGATVTTDSAGKTSTEARIGQYFATGLAARYLAQKGGAQTVNPAAAAPTDTLSPQDKQTLDNIKVEMAADLKKIDGYFGTKDGEDFITARNALLTKAYPDPADAGLVTHFHRYNTKEQLMERLNHDQANAHTLAAAV